MKRAGVELARKGEGKDNIERSIIAQLARVEKAARPSG
jgi:hypothetical protein